jgi:hypothetical protein
MCVLNTEKGPMSRFKKLTASVDKKLDTLEHQALALRGTEKVPRNPIAAHGGDLVRLVSLVCLVGLGCGGSFRPKPISHS